MLANKFLNLILPLLIFSVFIIPFLLNAQGGDSDDFQWGSGEGDGWQFDEDSGSEDSVEDSEESSSSNYPWNPDGESGWQFDDEGSTGDSEESSSGDFEDGAEGESGDGFEGGATGETGSGLQNPLSVGSFTELLETILTSIVMPIGAIIATLAIIYSGFLFVTAQGNVEKLETARKAFFWSVVGALVLLGSWAIAEVIEDTINQIIV